METKELIRAFRQGGTGNCVSIAIIKAGIQIFGMGKIFHHSWENEICEVTMRDEFELTFSKEELGLAIQGSKFILGENQQVFDYANLCFAAMAKRAQIEENDDIENPTYQDAINSLNDGEWYRHGPDWLGLRFNIRNIKRKHIWQYKGVVGASRKHCFFASEGMEDNYGKVDYIRGLERRSCSWFRVTETE